MRDMAAFVRPLARSNPEDGSRKVAGEPLSAGAFEDLVLGGWEAWVVAFRRVAAAVDGPEVAGGFLPQGWSK